MLSFALSSCTDELHATFLYSNICLLSQLKFILENTLLQGSGQNGKSNKHYLN